MMINTGITIPANPANLFLRSYLDFKIYSLDILVDISRLNNLYKHLQTDHFSGIDYLLKINWNFTKIKQRGRADCENRYYFELI